MGFNRKYDIRMPRLTERIHEFLRAKHLTGQVEHEFQNVDEPAGWAILTVDTADPKITMNCADPFQIWKGSLY
jgi:hypothetical protein